MVEGRNLNLEMDTIDIGGGFQGEENPKISHEFIANEINSFIEFNFDETYRFIAEPGRFIAHPCFDVALSVIGTKALKNNLGEIQHIDYYLSDGVYGWMHN